MNPRLAAIQLDTTPCEVNMNVHKAMGWAKRAFDADAKYVFFHEGLTADYTPDPMKYSRAIDSSEVYGFSYLAQQHKGYVALGLNEIWEGQPYISMVFLGPSGVIDVYRKSFLWPNKSQQEEGFDEFVAQYVPFKSGYRCERGILGAGDGTKVIKVGDLRIGCIICADGSQPEAWATFEKEKADLIFWQNNRTNVIRPGDAQEHAKELNTPMVVTNRCGFSYHAFLEGGTCFIADDGSVVAQANEKGEEEMIFADLADLRKSGWTG